ncbi:MAG: methyltransferase [Candidatus Kaiserbacteria bacterium]|nr:methyltransferase [Candidatus Kaiserbacteria bacterium]
MNTDEPLAYTIGDQPFLGLKIYLDSKPLIPRPETEWWVESLLSDVEKIFPVTGCPKAKPGPEGAEKSFPRRVKFLDLCAGSGAIGCAALARLPNAQVYFGEIEPAHEATILKNIRENNLDEPRADIRIGDLFEPFGDLKFDVIAVNPPYIPINRELPASVKNYEPALALRAGEDGLDLIRRIAISAKQHLTEGGMLWCECDSAHAATACTLFKAQEFTAEIRNDQYGVPRIIVVSFNSEN